MTRKPTETLLGSWPLRQTSLQVFGRFRRRGIRRHLRRRCRRLHRHPCWRFLLLPAPSWLRWPTTLSALGLVATIFLVQFWMAGGHKIYNSTMVQTITVITDYCHLWSAFCFGNWGHNVGIGICKQRSDSTSQMDISYRNPVWNPVFLNAYVFEHLTFHHTLILLKVLEPPGQWYSDIPILSLSAISGHYSM